MELRPLFITVALPIALIASAQPTLLPSIGIGALPLESDLICTLPLQTPSITSVGRDPGELAADFTLYDMDGVPFNLAAALSTGKPVLMISASYTCPVFRNHVGSINNVMASYGDRLTTVIVYTAEAHPDQDISPYFGVVNTGAQNQSAGILYRQSTTYGERMDVVQAMTAAMQIDAPILLDGPCNEWWDYYGPQPNNAYLIDTTGMIFAHHDWYDRFPQNIICDIDSLLGDPIDCNTSFLGSFTLELVSNDTIYGMDDPILTAHCLLTNPTTSDALVRVWKMNVQLPLGWSSSLCLDVCYQSHVDTAYITIPAGGEQHFYYYFYSPPSAGTGYSRVGFRNEDDNSNGYTVRLWGINSAPTEISTDVGPNSKWTLGPNPVEDWMHVTGPERWDALLILDATGREVVQVQGTGVLSTLVIPAGIHLAQPMYKNRPVGSPLRFVKM